jgi:hypothetical protein
MNPQTISDAAEKWLLESQDDDGDTMMADHVYDTPEFVWEVILNLAQRKMSEEQIALLAAGPLETLLASHGGDFIERIERQVQSSPKFAHLLGGVWRQEMPDAIWERIEKAREFKSW